MGIGIIPLVSTIVSIMFAITVLDQFFARRKPFQLLWAIGFMIYGVSAFTEFYTETYGLNVIMFRLWFFFGAILVAAYLGQGTVYLLLPRHVANILMIILGVFSVYALFRMFSVNITLGAAAHLTDKITVPFDITAITTVLSVYGTTALVGGALYSAWVFWRKKTYSYRVLSNILIAVGALLPAIGGSLLKLGTTRGWQFYSLELSGVLIIFVGFIRTREVFGLYRFPLIHGFKKVEIKPSEKFKKEPEQQINETR